MTLFQHECAQRLIILIFSDVMSGKKLLPSKVKCSNRHTQHCYNQPQQIDQYKSALFLSTNVENRSSWGGNLTEWGKDLHREVLWADPDKVSLDTRRNSQKCRAAHLPPTACSIQPCLHASMSFETHYQLSLGYVHMRVIPAMMALSP